MLDPADRPLMPGQADPWHPRPTRSARHRRPRRRRRVDVAHSLWLSGRVVIALVAVGVLTAAGFAWSTVRDFTSSIQHGAALPAAPTVAGVGGGKPHDIDGKDQNVLLLGNDSIAGATPAEVAALGTTMDRSDSATDTMMIMHIPADGSKATIVSFPRDSWVNIPGYGMSKLNAAFADAYVATKDHGGSDLDAKSAGISLVAQTLTQLTGLHIDHYVMVNLLGFYEISEAIGGVDLCLTQDQNDPYSDIHLHAGWNRGVKGTQALAFVRQRHGLPRGDIDRIVRQQYFLSAVFHKATSSSTLLNPLKVRSVLNAVSKSLVTDPSLDVMSFVQQLQKIAAGNIVFGHLPLVNINGQVDGQSVVLVDPDAIKAYIDKLIGVPADPKLAKAAPVPPAQVRVTVLNESNQNLIATRNAQALQQIGIAATVGDTTDHATTSLIRYPDGQQGQAKTLARYVPGAQLQLSGDVPTVTLVLGSDGVQVASLMAKSTATPESAPKAAPQAAPKATPQTTAKPTATQSASAADTSTAAQNAAGCIN